MIAGLVLLPPAVYALLSGEASLASPFLYTAAVSAALGFILYRNRDASPPTTSQAMIICVLSWAIISLVGAVPIVIILDVSWMDGIFESVSGFTTTGITMLTGLDHMPRSVILWRSISQWIGGLGILTFFLAVAARVPGAHRLMGAEGHKIFSGRPVPGLIHTVKILWTIYFVFTAVAAVAYILAGMSVFSGINHGLTTIATGGFSPHDQSIGYYAATGTGNHRLIEYIAIAGMTAGALSFIVHYRILRGEGLKPLFNGGEMRLFWKLIAVFFMVIIGERLLAGSPVTEASFRKVLFQTISVLTTTGYATEDLTSPFFGAAARQMFLLMMVIGGCAGSTSGGVKVLRISILFSVASEEIKKLFRADRAISGTRYDGTLLNRDETERIAGILFLWVLLLALGGTVTALLTPGMNGMTAASGMFSALGNIGPCFIAQQEMMNLHWGVKTTYIIGMLAGRLEILPVLLLFSRRAWR